MAGLPVHVSSDAGPFRCAALRCSALPRLCSQPVIQYKSVSTFPLDSSLHHQHLQPLISTTDQPSPSLFLQTSRLPAATARVLILVRDYTRSFPNPPSYFHFHSTIPIDSIISHVHQVCFHRPCCRCSRRHCRLRPRSHARQNRRQGRSDRLQ